MSEKVVVTGGAGFIGANLTHRLAQDGAHVVVLDDLSRSSVHHNLAWLLRAHPGRVEHVLADVRDPTAVALALKGADRVFHFAAQVAVTTSLDEPRHDFEVNALGTLVVLEAIRAMRSPPPLVFTSTKPTTARAGCRPTRGCGAPASTRRGASTSTARTAAPRAPPISTSSTTRGATGCPRSCSA
jgi:nucleoside-diphosphate-sugar epimerase